jgi:2'-5' RNA ligase
VRDALVDWQERVVGAGDGALRAVSREALHVTLCFLGQMPAERLAAVGEACAVVRGRSVRRLSVRGALWLPRRRPRVLALGVQDGRGELAQVQADLSAALVAAGLFKPENRAFLPHVTVARVRSGARVRVRELEAPSCGESDAERVTLYRSHLSRGPARYEALQRIELSRR